MLFCFVFYYLQTFYHLEGVAHYAAVFAPALKVKGLVVIVDKYLGEDPLVVVESLGPLRDSPLSEKAPRVKRGCGLHLCVRCALGGSRPFVHPARGTKETSGDSYV